MKIEADVRVSIFEVIKESAVEWDADNASRLSAALAFYSLLSLSPLIILLVGVAGAVFGERAARGQLAWQIHNVVGPDGAAAIQAMLDAAHHGRAGAAADVLSGLLLLIGASSMMVELRSDLNAIWHVEVAASNFGIKAIWSLLKDRFYSVLLIAGTGLVLFVFVAASAWVSWMGRFLAARLPISETWLHLIVFLGSCAVFALLFAGIYRWVPDVELEWRDVAVGACFTSLIFAAGKQLISLYLGKAAFASSYGAAGSLVVLLAWMYYSAQLFFFGAEFTKVWARRIGSHSG